MKTTSLPISRDLDKTVEQTPARSLEEVLDRVREDAVTGSQQYLDETTVPHGGE